MRDALAVLVLGCCATVAVAQSPSFHVGIIGPEQPTTDVFLVQGGVFFDVQVSVPPGGGYLLAASGPLTHWNEFDLTTAWMIAAEPVSQTFFLHDMYFPVQLIGSAFALQSWLVGNDNVVHVSPVQNLLVVDPEGDGGAAAGTADTNPAFPSVSEALPMAATTDPRHPLDPEVEPLFDLLDLGIDVAALTSSNPLPVEGSFYVPSGAGSVRVRLFSATPLGGVGRKILVYAHGGGFVDLSPETHIALTRSLAVATGAVVFSVDYRLAPQNPFPAAVIDCVEVVQWARTFGFWFGSTPPVVAVAGDSAGANLAAATSLALVAAGLPAPDAMVLISPWLDLTLGAPSIAVFGADDPVVTTSDLLAFGAAYVQSPALPTSPFASPLLVPDASVFPPTCVVTGGIDPLLDDGIDFADRLQTAGVVVDHAHFPGMPHSFVLLPGLSAREAAINHIATFMNQVLP